MLNKGGSFVWQFIFAVPDAYLSTISIFPQSTLSLHFCKIGFSAINFYLFQGSDGVSDPHFAKRCE